MGIRIEGQAVGLGQGCASSAILGERNAWIERQCDIFGNGQRFEQREMLNTMPMPSALASPGEPMETVEPPQTISPALGCKTPNSILTRVDFPAPFSPSRAWISPERSKDRSRCMRRNCRNIWSGLEPIEAILLPHSARQSLRSPHPHCAHLLPRLLSQYAISSSA